MDLEGLIDRQHAYYASGATRSYTSRIQALKELFRVLKFFESRLFEALNEDLNKQPYESRMTELGLVYTEIRYYEKHLKSWMKEKRYPAPITIFPSKCFVSPEPYGSVLIVSPWNYPVYLSLMPVIGALAAGNCVVLKTSSKCPHVNAVLHEMFAYAFPEEHIAVISGSRDEYTDLFRQKWDYMFYTGSKDGGRQVLTAAAETFTPVTLELGGKDPAIIDPTADIAKAAKRIAFGKCLNAGQTCIAPDYLLIHESVRDQFVEEYEKALHKFFPKDDMSGLVTIIDDSHYQRLLGLMEGQEMPLSHETDDELRFIEPTVITGVTPDSPIMQEEVFGPVLPIITWTDLNWCIDYIRSNDRPLALYVFSEDKNIVSRFMNECSFGGGCINDTILQICNNKLPFGGIGASGMGQYHGKRTFDTFTHYRGMADRTKKPDLNIRFFPYAKWKDFVLSKFMR